MEREGISAGTVQTPSMDTRDLLAQEEKGEVGAGATEAEADLGAGMTEGKDTRVGPWHIAEWVWMLCL